MSFLRNLFGSSDSNSSGSSSSSSKSKSVEESAKDELKTFVGKAPEATYRFDSERDAPQSEICREDTKAGRECIMIKMHSTRLLQAMQELDFFCMLPNDPSRTYIECTPLPKSS